MFEFNEMMLKQYEYQLVGEKSESKGKKKRNYERLFDGRKVKI